jgi:hypothetical protein
LVSLNAQAFSKFRSIGSRQALSRAESQGLN